MSYAQTEQAVYLYGNQLNIPCPADLAPLNAGDVVVLGGANPFVGVALGPINANGDPGRSLCIGGGAVFSFNKETGAAIDLGDTVVWDDSAKVAFETGGGYSDSAAIGVATAAAGTDDLTIPVMLGMYPPAV